jgi:[acyl-carrier-protein] S-malonyltransferase
VTAVVELAPAGVLAGLVRRRLPDVELVALRSPDDLEHARSVVRAHVPTGEHLTTDWQVVTAPTRGTFHPVGDSDGDGRMTAVVRGRGGDVPVAVGPGVVVEWLAVDGDPVAAGQPVARVRVGASA